MSGLDIPNNRVMIDIACNDPDNGVFCYFAQQIQIGELMELEARRSPPPRFVELPGKIRLAGKVWPICGSKDYVGNWCWNGYWFDIPTAVDFLVWLHRRHLFNLTTGETRIFNRWKWREPFGKNDRDFLDRMLILAAVSAMDGTRLQSAQLRSQTDARRPDPQR